MSFGIDPSLDWAVWPLKFHEVQIQGALHNVITVISAGICTDADVVVGHLSSNELRKADASALSSRKDNGLTYGE